MLETAAAAPAGAAPTFIGAATVCPDMAELLSDEEIEERTPEEWERDGDEIVRTYEFDDYLDGVGFAAGAGGVAQDAFHHPEITIDYGAVEIRLTSHEEGGITDRDVDLAERFDGLVD